MKLEPISKEMFSRKSGKTETMSYLQYTKIITKQVYKLNNKAIEEIKGERDE